MVGHLNKILIGDVIEQLKTLDDNLVDCVVTSPPYWGLRDYGVEGQLGLEQSPNEYVAAMVAVFQEVRRVLKDDGTLWLNIGDSYVGGKGASGQGSPEYQARRKAKGLSLNNHYHQVGGQKVTRALDDRAKMREANLKPKDLVGIPWRVAFALQSDGWYLRQDIIWAKPNPMPESVRDRCTKSHEYIFLLTKSPKYYFDNEAIKEQSVSNIKNSKIRFGGNKYGDSTDPKHQTKSGNVWQPSLLRNKRDVWMIPTQPFQGAHFAVMPKAVVEPCVLAGSKVGGIVLDPFFGSGTTGVVALQHNRKYIGIELNPEYAAIAEKRLQEAGGLFK